MCGYETVFECNRDTKRMEVSIGRLWEDESRESERERGSDGERESKGEFDENLRAWTPKLAKKMFTGTCLDRINGLTHE